MNEKPEENLKALLEEVTANDNLIGDAKQNKNELNPVDIEDLPERKEIHSKNSLGFSLKAKAYTNRFIIITVIVFLIFIVGFILSDNITDLF